MLMFFWCCSVKLLLTYLIHLKIVNLQVYIFFISFCWCNIGQVGHGKSPSSEVGNDRKSLRNTALESVGALTWQY